MPQRMGVTLFTLFSALALALATIGIYGVASYVAASRTREIGVRIALGATRSPFAASILLQGIGRSSSASRSAWRWRIYSSRAGQGLSVQRQSIRSAHIRGVTLLLGVVALRRAMCRRDEPRELNRSWH